ncbi:MAG: Calx-beta domain-containing protein [Dolichospermum sp.]
MVWSFAEKTTFLPSDGGIAFTAADKATILGAMQTAYDGSSTAKTMFDNWIDAGKTIEIKFVPGAFAAYPNTGKLELDLSFLTNNTYITPTGKAVEDTAVTAIVHELGHALTGRRDNGDYVTDYKGENVKFVNQIYQELGLPEQISYIAYDDDGSLHELNFDYTEGATIDRAVSRDSDWNSSAAGNSKDLLIGGPSANTLQSGDGNDFLWGAGGNDSLFGGNGTDTVGFKGKPTDYDLRQNPDGTWTSRHVRGAANEGTDTITNIEKVMFKGGETFDLKKKGLTYQLDFALVIDTTGSMGDDIGAVKAQGNAIINALFADDTKDARIGIVGFKDTTIGQPTSIILPFTDQNQFADRKTAALNALNGISVSGGGDLPETAFDGLLKALNGTMGNWRPGAGVHRVVLFTDAPAKDRSLKGAVDALAANIGATITSSSRAVGASGTLDSFTFSAIAPNSSEKELFSPGSRDEDPVLPPFEFIDESPTPDTSIANLEIYTIYTGNFGSLDPDLESIASTTGGSSFVAPDPDDLVNTLLTIINLPSITLAVSPESVTEDGTNNLVYTFTRTGATTTALTVTYTIGGTATNGSDYASLPTSIAFAAGLATATVIVDPTADTTVESNETVALTLASGTGYTIGTTTAVTGTINNDDFFQLSINNVTVVEGQDSNATLTVTVNNPNPQQISVNYATAPVNATANVDYTSKTGTLIIPANISTANITIPILNDHLNESDKAFTVTLSNPTNATINPNEASGQVIITDTLQSSINKTLATNVENLTLTGTTAINGTGNAGNNILTGNSTNNTLNGEDGNDTLNGGAGIDTLIGGAGNDIYVVDSTTDVITEVASQGIDTVQSSVTFTLANVANVENLTLTGTTAINGTGNTGNNILTGNGGNNTLNGGDGNDTLNGGAGIDTLNGGAGNDIYVVDSITDTITESANAGTDTIQSSVTYTIATLTNIENLTLATLAGAAAINGTGNTGNNVITGNSANNILNGGAGIDTLIGGAGNDIYVVDTTTDTITENANAGTDTIQSSVTYTIAALANVENLTLTGTAAINGTGNAGNNVITGNGANNTLNGGAGNDTLNGGAGDDTYIFTINGIGLGRDTITDGSGVDTISFAGTDATTSIRLNLGTSFGQTVDANTNTKVVLTADAIENAIGGDGNDRLIGNSLDNTLEGGLGNDILNGSTGNDFLFGGDGNDSLSGGDGDDFLTGGLGSNNLLGGTGSDQFVFSEAISFNTVDIIADFSTGIDQLVLSKTVFDFLSSDVGIGLSDTSDFDYVEDDEFAGDSNARIVYSETSGSLFYNQDGATAGFGTGGEFAVLDPLTANDFVIIA